MKSNDSPEIRDWAETSDIPSLPSLENVQKNGPAGRKNQDRKSNRTRQKNKRGDSKVESNDSPEIPDGGRHQTTPASLRELFFFTILNHFK